MSPLDFVFQLLGHIERRMALILKDKEENMILSIGRCLSQIHISEANNNLIANEITDIYG